VKKFSKIICIIIAITLMGSLNIPVSAAGPAITVTKLTDVGEGVADITIGLTGNTGIEGFNISEFKVNGAVVSPEIMAIDPGNAFGGFKLPNGAVNTETITTSNFNLFTIRVTGTPGSVVSIEIDVRLLAGAPVVGTVITGTGSVTLSGTLPTNDPVISIHKIADDREGTADLELRLSNNTEGINGFRLTGVRVGGMPVTPIDVIKTVYDAEGLFFATPDGGVSVDPVTGNLNLFTITITGTPGTSVSVSVDVSLYDAEIVENKLTRSATIALDAADSGNNGGGGGDTGGGTGGGGTGGGGGGTTTPPATGGGTFRPLPVDNAMSGVAINGSAFSMTQSELNAAYAAGSLVLTGRVNMVRDTARFTIPVSTLRTAANATRNADKEFVFIFDVPTVGAFHLPANIVSLIPGYDAIVTGKSGVSVRVTVTDRKRVTVTGAFTSIANFELALVDGDNAVLEVITEFDGGIKRTLPVNDGAAIPELWEVRTRSNSQDAWSTNKFIPAIYNKDAGVIEIISNTNSEYVAVEFNNIFTDIEEDQWFYDYVTAAASRRLMNGMSPTTYVPDAELTRAQFITMMVRALRLPAAADDTEDYDDMIEWAQEYIIRARCAGLIDLLGTEDNKILPDQPMTREEVAYILAKAAAYVGFTTDSKVDLENRFEDADIISEVYAKYVEATVALELMHGMTAATFGADGTFTRAQAATVLVRFCRALGWMD